MPSPVAILRAAQAHGITLELVEDKDSIGGFKLRARGRDDVVARFKPALVAHRTAIVETLRQQLLGGGGEGGGSQAGNQTAGPRARPARASPAIYERWIFEAAARDCPDESLVVVLHDRRGRPYKAVPLREYAEVVAALSEGQPG